MSDKSNGLNGFTQTHLIGEYAVQVVVIQRHKPFQSLQLKTKEVFKNKTILFRTYFKFLVRKGCNYLIFFQGSVFQYSRLFSDCLTDVVSNCIIRGRIISRVVIVNVFRGLLLQTNIGLESHNRLLLEYFSLNWWQVVLQTFSYSTGILTITFSSSFFNSLSFSACSGVCSTVSFSPSLFSPD